MKVSFHCFAKKRDDSEDETSLKGAMKELMTLHCRGQDVRENVLTESHLLPEICGIWGRILTLLGQGQCQGKVGDKLFRAFIKKLQGLSYIYWYAVETKIIKDSRASELKGIIEEIIVLIGKRTEMLSDKENDRFVRIMQQTVPN